MNERQAILGQGQPEMKFDMNNAQGAGLIVQPVDLQSSVLPLYTTVAPLHNLLIWYYLDNNSEYHS